MRRENLLARLLRALSGKSQEQMGGRSVFTPPSSLSSRSEPVGPAATTWNVWRRARDHPPGGSGDPEPL